MVTSESDLCQIDRLSPRERRQSAILDAAESLFLEQGYERTSLAEIVKRSGGSLATLYELFGNKQGLLRAIATRWCDEAMLRSLDDDAMQGVSGVEILRRYAHRQSELMESPHAVGLMRMLISESLRDHEFAMQIYLDLHVPALEELIELFAEWAATGRAEIDRPDAAARLFFDIVVGDSMLNTLMGIETEWLDSEQIDWRLQPFFSHFKIR